MLNEQHIVMPSQPSSDPSPDVFLAPKISLSPRRRCNQNKILEENWRKRRWPVHNPASSRKEARRPDTVETTTTTTIRPFQPIRGRFLNDRKLRSTPTTSSETEAAVQFSQDCRKAALNDNFRTFPRLSYYVDAMMKAPKSRTSQHNSEEKMRFIKTSDGLIKVVFSTESNETDIATIPKRTTRDVTIPVVQPKEDSVTLSNEQTILPSRVIFSGRLPLKTTEKSTKPLVPLKNTTMLSMTHVPLQSRVICEGSNMFDGSSLSNPESNRLSKPHPLARFGSGSTPVGGEKSLHCIGTLSESAVENPANPCLPLALLQLKGSTVASASAIQTSQSSSRSQPLASHLHQSDQSCYCSGVVRQSEYLPSQSHSSYFIPSISAALKAAVQPHVPSVQTPTTTPLSSGQQHSYELSNEAALALYNMLKALKSGTQLQSVIQSSPMQTTRHEAKQRY